ncbi:MAG TPA: response regulator [Syntrophorhabdaceae bacterium]|nr:response regulator [Syntrophorhabdaceae bacterium]
MSDENDVYLSNECLIDAENSEMTGEENETILIADDDSDIRLTAREILEIYGYSVIEAVDGEDAVNKFRQNRPLDLIILDMIMPKKNGWEVYKEIREIDPHMKILIASGYTEDMVTDNLNDGEKIEFLTKPLLFDELLRRIREMLDK